MKERDGNKMSINNKISLFKKNVIIEKKRSCLMCNKIFKSKGPHNRRCKRCERSVVIKVNNGYKEAIVCKLFNTRSLEWQHSGI